MHKLHLSRRAGALILSGFVLLSLLGCLPKTEQDSAFASSPNQPTRSTVPQSNPQVDPALVKANTQFGFKLYSEVLKRDNGKNVFVSPSSVAIALAMAYNGANGETQQAMAKALELQGMSLEQVNQANAALKAALEQTDPNVQLAIANSLWSRQGSAFRPEFLQRSRDSYQAQVMEVNFGQPSATTAINNWVSQSTRGKINQIVQQTKPSDLLYLINAIYFKGKWSDEFDPKDTVQRPFSLANGSQKQHPLMSRTGEYRYYETEQFQAASLPYGQGRYSLYVFLPKPTSNLSAFQKNLSVENWDQWMQQFRSREGTLQIPRFKLEYEASLNEALQALGMGVAFSDRADFSGMFPPDTAQATRIDQVKHKTFVEVNEEGTEAAAVTSVMMPTSAQIPQEPFKMVVDRPFFCAIRDNQTGTVLFMGSIVNP